MYDNANIKDVLNIHVYIYCGYSLEVRQRGGSNMYPQSMFWSKNVKSIKYFLIVHVYCMGKFS